VTQIIDLRRGWPKDGGPSTNYVQACPHCGDIFHLRVPLFQYKSYMFDDWITGIIKHRFECGAKKP